MDQTIRNVFCIGRNYAQHAAELGNALPDKPMAFMKPTHAVVPMDGRTLSLPADKGEIHYEAELVIRIGRAYEAGLSVDELASGLALGIDFTLRTLQDKLKQKGQPWLEAKGFLQSAPLGPFRPFPGVEALQRTQFRLEKNGETVQAGTSDQMIFDLQQIVEFIAANYGLGEGDILFTGTPAGVGPVADGDRYELFWGEESTGSVKISL